MTRTMIRVELGDFIVSARKHSERDWPRAIVGGVAELAERASVAVQMITAQKFKLHSDYIIKGIRHTPSNPSQKLRAIGALKRFGDFNAYVYLRPSNSPKRSLEFMADHEYGEERQPQDKWLALPMPDLKKRAFKTGRGAVRKRWKPETLLQHFNETNSRYNGSTTDSDNKRKGRRRNPSDAFLMRSRAGSPMIVRRVGKQRGDIEVLYLFKKSVNIKKSWDFVDTVYYVVRRDYATVLQDRIAELPDYK